MACNYSLNTQQFERELPQQIVNCTYVHKQKKTFNFLESFKLQL